MWFLQFTPLGQQAMCLISFVFQWFSTGFQGVFKGNQNEIAPAADSAIFPCIEI
jgi:hypothetical protein